MTCKQLQMDRHSSPHSCISCHPRILASSHPRILTSHHFRARSPKILANPIRGHTEVKQTGIGTNMEPAWTTASFFEVMRSSGQQGLHPPRALYPSQSRRWSSTPGSSFFFLFLFCSTAADAQTKNNPHPQDPQTRLAPNLLPREGSLQMGFLAGVFPQKTTSVLRSP